MAKKKKRRSQAPVALVYFLTLLLALSLAGGVSYYLLKKYEVFKPGVSDSKADSTRSVGILFARVNDTGDFQDMCVMRIDPFNKEITIIPQSDVTKTSDGKTYKELMNSGGVELLRKKAAENLGGINIDFYATVTNSAFEQVADLMGGMSYTAPQELYHISQESSKDDISLQKGDLVTLSGRQIVNLASYDIFNDKKAGNLTFLSSALEQVINNGFRQATVTKDNLYNIYEIITSGSSTNLTKDAFNEIRRYLEVMLDERDIPAKSL
ncbi:MAG: LCP family protein, partial [Ruminococcus sp.]|nr:LCP family protein [Ruminococcus sp.]